MAQLVTDLDHQGEASAAARGSAWRRYATTDPATASDFLMTAYADMGMNVKISEQRSSGFRLGSSSAQLVDVGLSRVLYTGRVQVQLNLNADLLIGTLLRGRYRVRWRSAGRSQEHALEPGHPFLWLPDRASDADYAGDAVAVILPRALLEDVAETDTGLPGAQLRFDAVHPISPALGRYWSATVTHIQHTVLADAALAANPLIAGPARRLLAAAALAVFPNTSMHAEPGPAGRVAPAAVRRAQAHAQDHPDREVTVADMAAAAGGGVRALQHAFARHLDATPTAYARRVRLHHAHRNLQAADPAAGDTVAVIAARWGFANPSRFSTDYRAAYGQPPSRTLHS